MGLPWRAEVTKGRLSGALDWRECLCCWGTWGRGTHRGSGAAASQPSRPWKDEGEQCSPGGLGCGGHPTVGPGTSFTSPCPDLILAKQAFSRGREGTAEVPTVGRQQQTRGRAESVGTGRSQPGLHLPPLGATRRAGWPCPGSLCLPQAQESGSRALLWRRGSRWLL